MFREIKDNNDCLSLKELAVGGNDLMNLGIKPGPGIGVILNKLLLDEVLQEPSRNNREYLLDKAKQLADTI